MKIIADKHIPFIKDFFESNNDLVLLPGDKIKNKDVLDADILIVRTITAVNKELLQNSKVSYVASATSGADHIDTKYLKANKINYYIAEGCNSNAVKDYIVACTALLLNKRILSDKNFRVGIIGVGKIGSRVAEFFKFLGYEVLLCDPLRAQLEKNFSSTDVGDFANLDLITLHVPLTYTGEFPTYHLIDKDFLKRQKKGCVLINSSRGAVINFKDLKQCGNHLVWCLDVWENEPNIDLDILNAAYIATPHIAGYSQQAKYLATKMVYDFLVNKKLITPLLQELQINSSPLRLDNQNLNWWDVALANYNPDATTHWMKENLNNKTMTFEELRRNYPLRSEF